VNEIKLERIVETQLRYCIEVEGEIGLEWATWFGANALRAAGGRTWIELQVADQAQLHSALRRIHDLHLQIASLTRFDETPTLPGGSDDAM